MVKTVEETVKVSKKGTITVKTTTETAEGRNKKAAVYSVAEASKGAGKKNAGKVELSSITVKAKVEAIPDTIKVNGKTYKVDSIGENALASNKKVRELTIGKYVTTIGENAFANAKKLKDIQIYSNVTEVGAGAFDGIAKNAVITIHADEKTFEAIVKLIKASGVGKKVKFVRAE